MWEQINANRNRSIILVIGMGALLVALGYGIGVYFFASAYAGVGVAAVVWIIMTLVGYFQGDSILLATAGAKKIEKKDHPRLFNVVEEMTIACGLPKMPAVYIIDDPALLSDAAALTVDAAKIVDPIPQALVLTAIVIGVGVTALMLTYVVRLHDREGTLDVRELRNLKW